MGFGAALHERNGLFCCGLTANQAPITPSILRSRVASSSGGAAPAGRLTRSPTNRHAEPDPLF